MISRAQKVGPQKHSRSSVEFGYQDAVFGPILEMAFCIAAPSRRLLNYGCRLVDYTIGVTPSTFEA
jgi:hypothetical protein